MKCAACGYQNDVSEFIQFHDLIQLEKQGTRIKLYACLNCGNLMIDDYIIKKLKEIKK